MICEVQLPVDQTIRLRTEPRPEDREHIRAILASSGFFYDFEIDVAVELLDEYFAKGESSGYNFIFADQGDQTVGYVCYGPIVMAAAHRFDLYWIGVHEKCRGLGIGKQLMQMTEKAISCRDGKYIYVETSSRPIYEPTRQFYLKQQYDLVARIPHYYGDNDDRIVFLKTLAG